MPVSRLDRYRRKQRHTLVGLMSGTSLDGIDAVLMNIRDTEKNPHITIRAFLTQPLPSAVRDTVLRWYETGQAALEEMSQMHALMGQLSARAVIRCCKKANIDVQRVDACGSHGLTVWHQPVARKFAGRRVRSTLQIGDGAIIAQTTGLVTVTDFRPADMARGGEGAPLVPAFDVALFASRTESRALLNIGGIANWTVIPKGSGKNAMAWDIGPGNMVIDAMVRALYGKPYDRGGRIAAAGSPSLRLIMTLLAHPFLQRRPPKSTGREEFGDTFVNALIDQGRRAGLSDADLVATATAFTAEIIGESYRRIVEPRFALDRVIVSGGGAHNRTLLAHLADVLPDIPVESIAAHGFSPDAKEAVAFAWLAHQTLMERPANHPASTGAAGPAILGKISLPPVG